MLKIWVLGWLVPSQTNAVIQMCEVDLLLWLDSVDSVFDLDRFFPYAAVSQRIMLRILQSLGIYVNLEIVLPVRAKDPILPVLVVCVNRR